MAQQPRSIHQPARVVLEGVPRASFYDGGPRCPEDFPFPGSLRACLEFMGENRGCEHAAGHDPTRRPKCMYAFINGTSGMASRLLWNQHAWDFGNGDILRMAADPAEPIRRAFEAVGYGHEFLLKEEHARQIGFQGKVSDDEDEYRRRIVESLRDRGRPLLAFGVVGPPECCVITGYDEGGDVLTGWSFFQGFPEFSGGLEFEPAGYFRKRGWFKDTLGLIAIGEKQDKPPLGEVCRKALRWALEVARTPSVRGYHSGLAAYTAWTEALLREEECNTADMAALRERYGVHFDAVGVVAEGRWYGAQFLEEMAEQEPTMAEALEAAARCYEAEHDLMWQVWNLAGGNGYTDEHVRKWSEPDVRRAIVPVILQARDKDIEAAGHTERALAS